MKKLMKCNECGHIFEIHKDSPVFICPSCGSKDLSISDEKVVKKTTDFELADLKDDEDVIKDDVLGPKRTWKGFKVGIFIFLIFVTYMIVMGIDNKEVETSTLRHEDIILKEAIPNIDFENTNIICNDSNSLMIELYDLAENESLHILNSFKDFGYIVDEYIDGSLIEVNHDKGYRLVYYYFDSLQEGSLSVETAIVLNDGQLPNIDILNKIPTINTNKYKISHIDEYITEFYIQMNIDEFTTYTKECIEYGFSVDVYNDVRSFSAKNKDGLCINIDYLGSNITRFSIYG